MPACGGRPKLATDCAAIFGCGTPLESSAGIPKRDMAAAKALLKEANVDFSKPIVMLHVANAPGIAALGNVTRQVLVDLGFKVDMRAMDFQTFATSRLNTGPVDKGGWNIAHTTNTVPDQSNPMSNPFLVATGQPDRGLGLADRSGDRGAAAEIRQGHGRRRAQIDRRRRSRPAPMSRCSICRSPSSPHPRRGATISTAC